MDNNRSKITSSLMQIDDSYVTHRISFCILCNIKSIIWQTSILIKSSIIWQTLIFGNFLVIGLSSIMHTVLNIDRVGQYIGQDLLFLPLRIQYGWIGDTSLGAHIGWFLVYRPVKGRYETVINQLIWIFFSLGSNLMGLGSILNPNPLNLYTYPHGRSKGKP